MNRAPLVPPPPAPPVPPTVAPPSVPPLVTTGRALLGFVGCAGLCSLWAGLWAFVVPPDVALLSCVAVPGAALGLVATGYAALPLLDAAGRLVLGWQTGRQELELRWASVQAGLDLLDAYRGRYLRPRRRRVAAPVEETAIYHWQDNGDRASGARVAADATTQRLPPLLPSAPPPYRGTALEIIVAALAADAPCSVRQRPGGLTRPTFEAAVAQLIAAGIVSQERGRPPALTPPFARVADTPNYLHAAVARRLRDQEA